METFGNIMLASLLCIFMLFTITTYVNFISNIALSPNEWLCTKTTFIGKTPYQREICSQYTMKGVK